MRRFSGRVIPQGARGGQAAGPTAGQTAGHALRTAGLLGAFLVVCLVAGVLASGLILPAAGAAGFLARSSTSYYDQLPSDLSLPPLSQSSRMVDAQGNLIAVFYSENRSLTSINQVSDHMKNAVIAIEDARFFEHGGVDTRGTIRAFVNNIIGGDTQGASTLTQQVVKNILIEQAVYDGDEEAARAAAEASGPEGYGRKLRETRLAIALEEELDKEQVQELYLNLANFSNATFGVQAAARYYFSVNAADLSLSQSATLAGIVQLPGRYDPIDNPEAAQSRRDVVLSRMLDLEFITAEEHDAAVAEDLTLQIEEPQRGCASAGQSAFFCDYVIARFLADARYGENVADRENLLNRGGLTITTTLDPVAQQAAAEAVRSQFPDNERAGAAMSVVEPGTGNVLAMAQNRAYGLDVEQPGVTAVNFNVDERWNGTQGFQPGSGFKPITLSQWLTSGRSLNERIPAPSQITVRENQFTQCGAPRQSTQTWSPGNSGGVSEPVTTVARATFESLNTGYVNMLLQLDLCDVADVAFELGVHPATDPAAKVATDPSMTLGTAGVAPLSMATAYATFAADGVQCDPVGVTSITDREGEELEIPSANCSQVLEPDVARGVSLALQETIRQGTAQRVTEGGNLLGRPAAGKTGTTNDFREVWFNGYTPNLAASVWVGDPAVDGRKLNLDDFPIGGVTYDQVFGSTFALPIWTSFMTSGALDEMGLPPEGFTAPGQDVVSGPLSAVPSVVGQGVDDAQSTLQQAGFSPVVSDERRFDPRVPEGVVAAQSPDGGSQLRAGDQVVLLVSGGQRPDGDGDGDDLPIPIPDPRPDPDRDRGGGGGGGGGDD